MTNQICVSFRIPFLLRKQTFIITVYADFQILQRIKVFVETKKTPKNSMFESSRNGIFGIFIIKSEKETTNFLRKTKWRYADMNYKKISKI